jgi:transposase
VCDNLAFIADHAVKRQATAHFDELNVRIGGEAARVYLFVATLSYSRRGYVRAFLHERQGAWFEGMEGAFATFGGVPQEVLFNNVRMMVEHHDAATREVRNERLRAFVRYWGFVPRACAPYRARTKGKDESGVSYVKRNAIAGHAFANSRSLRRILSCGRARLPIRAGMGRLGRPRSSASGAMRLAHSSRFAAARPSVSTAS